ncbi:hypothetical protein CHLNCDRAFT_57955 [Chlorella variabilis]|uniref:Heme-binding protein 2 n=1 Tax=Chlorella variabilis TaxID=554065 RepID=E1ZFQ7_CHLVA|nr:hypothetical protein CHLNCDRAFT_57955 [Chlorella variabilis]EFN55172.1 hypothetical protein CHLNCDRAFT_57955 [Chlorella variabilis]|eukprot:XP_005847274.1 hypothetical protein CHLNCDRAFT_57955 [Chlorella variabilis]
MQHRAAALLLCLVAAGTAPARAARPAASAALTAGAAAGLPVGAPAPWFCHNLDCPKFTVVNTTDDYEVRYYEAGAWVSTDVEAYAYALGVSKGFQRLYQYIDGANHAAVKIPMTAPVRTLISAAAGPFCKSNFTISFFVPFAFQKDGAPKPNNPDVYLDHSPAFTAFVAQSGGFVMDDFSVTRMAKRLTDALDRDEQPYNADTFFFAGYDPPFRLMGRHNEVWVVAEEETGAQTS